MVEVKKKKKLKLRIMRLIPPFYMYIIYRNGNYSFRVNKVGSQLKVTNDKAFVDENFIK